MRDQEKSHSADCSNEGLDRYSSQLYWQGMIHMTFSFFFLLQSLLQKLGFKCLSHLVKDDTITHRFDLFTMLYKLIGEKILPVLLNTSFSFQACYLWRISSRDGCTFSISITPFPEEL